MTNSNDLEVGDKFNAFGIEWIVTEKQIFGVIAKATNEEVFKKIYQGTECVFVCEMVNKLPF